MMQAVRHKVLFLPRWYPSKEDVQNGVFIQKHARAAALENLVVVLYAQPSKEGPLTVINTAAPLLKEVIVYYKPSVLKPLNALLYVAALFSGWKQVRKSGFFPDICHVHVLNRPALLALWLKRMHGVPFILSEHWSGYITGKFEQRGLLSGLITAAAVKQASLITVVSNALKSGMLKCGLNADYRIVPNVVEVFPQNGKQQNFLNGKFRYLAVADLRDDIKNISGMIRAFKKVYESDPHTELVLAGDGPDRKMLEQLADQHSLPVSFIGRLTNDEVLKLIPTTHVTIINSNIETFSVVTLEAIFSGRPVISTRCGGPEQFINEQNGILIDTGNEEQLAAAMLQIKSRYSYYNEQQVKTSIANKYSLEAIGNNLNILYSETLNR